MTQPADSAEFSALLRGIMEDPERVLSEDISDAQLLALQRELNPYAYVGAPEIDGRRQTVALSCTNLREEYIRQFTMTGLVGFVFRMLDEWAPEAAVRRWVAAAAARRERRRRREAVTAAFTPDELAARAEGLQVLAGLARDAQAEADAAVAAARAADEAARDGALVAAFEGAGAGPAAGTTEAAAAAAAALAAADAALAKARGLAYTAAYNLRRFGLEADDRIDAQAALARQHPECREIIDRDPVERAPAGEREVPVEVAKRLVGAFLRGLFEYNPDAHVRSAYDEFVVAPVVAPAAGPGDAAALGPLPTDRADPARVPLAALRAAPPAALPGDAAALAALAPPRLREAALALLATPATAAAAAALGAAPERFRRYLAPVPPGAPARAAVDVVPPADTFHRWAYYLETNMEALRAATAAIYHSKPDLDLAFVVYRAFEGTPAETDAAFAAFQDAHQEEVISDIKHVTAGAWTLLGDFQQNREKISFYNKHTEVLKRILDRHAEDKKLGQELMKNRVRQRKAQNIREAGPDAPGLGEYASALGGAGGERVIGREEMYRLERARGNVRAAKELELADQCRETIRALSEAAKVRELGPDEARRLADAQADLGRAREMLEVPDDAIQVDVWTHDPAAAGGARFGRSKFYTKAEAPLAPEEAARAAAAAAGRPANLAGAEGRAPGPPRALGALGLSTLAEAEGPPATPSPLELLSSPCMTPSPLGPPMTPSPLGPPMTPSPLELPLAPYAQAYLEAQLEQERAESEAREREERARRVGLKAE